MNSTCSICKAYGNDRSVTINPSEFPETCGTLRQNILPITVSTENLGPFGPNTINVRIGTFSYTLMTSGLQNTGSFAQQAPIPGFTYNFTEAGNTGNQGMSICGGQPLDTPNATFNVVTINNYRYILSLLVCCGGVARGVNVQFQQSLQQTISTNDHQ